MVSGRKKWKKETQTHLLSFFYAQNYVCIALKIHLYIYSTETEQF